MSNKTQLQTNNTALDSLITRVNAAKDVATSLPEAGSGGGFITNKQNGSTIDVTNQAPSTTSVIYTYTTLKPIKQAYHGYIQNNSTYLEGALPGTEITIGGGIHDLEISADKLSCDFKLRTVSGSSYSGEYTLTSFITVIGEDNSSDIDFFNIKGNQYVCYIKGTKIRLFDNTFKLVEDITYNDELLVWDFDNACYNSAKPLWIKKPELASYYYHCIFENGIELNLVGSDGNCHAIYCVDTNCFEYANRCVGKSVMMNTGVTKLISCDRIDEEVEFYNIMTDYHINCYANNVLTSSKLNNIYPMKQMKFIKEDRQIIPYSVYSEIPIEFYKGLRLNERKAEDVEWITKNIKIKLLKQLRRN